MDVPGATGRKTVAASLRIEAVAPAVFDALLAREGRPPRQPIGSEEIHLWAFDLDRLEEEQAALRGRLSDAERARAARFHFEVHQRRFVACRGLLRGLLGSYLHLPPEAMAFVYGAQGKPSVLPALNPIDLQFNLSHSEHLVVFAFSRQQALGVDVEVMREIEDWPGIAAKFFHPNEVQNLRTLPHTSRNRHFLRYWTCKEAYLKARGWGIGDGLERLDCTAFQQDGRGFFTDPDNQTTWACTEFTPADEATAAIVAECAVGEVMLYNAV